MFLIFACRAHIFHFRCHFCTIRTLNLIFREVLVFSSLSMTSRPTKKYLLGDTQYNNSDGLRGKIRGFRMRRKIQDGGREGKGGGKEEKLGRSFPPHYSSSWRVRALIKKKRRCVYVLCFVPVVRCVRCPLFCFFFFKNKLVLSLSTFCFWF